MRVSTSLQFDRLRDRMGALSSRADSLNNQLSTGKRITAPSDDAAGYRALSSIRRATVDTTAELANVDLATSLLDSSATALGAIQSQLTRVREIAVNAGSSTLSPEQKTALAAELDVIREDLVRIANTTDARGGPLFSGDSDKPPYEDVGGSVTYTGSGRASEIPIGDGRTIAARVSGDEVFGGIQRVGTTPGSIFDIVQDLSSALKANAPVGDLGTDVQTGLTSVINAITSVGARGARLELEKTRLDDLALTREVERSAIEDVDVTTTITELQKTLTVLQATQASFSKLTSLTLFDYIR